MCLKWSEWQKTSAKRDTYSPSAIYHLPSCSPSITSACAASVCMAVCAVLSHSSFVILRNKTLKAQRARSPGRNHPNCTSPQIKRLMTTVKRKWAKHKISIWLHKTPFDFGTGPGQLQFLLPLPFGKERKQGVKTTTLVWVMIKHCPEVWRII